MLAVESIETAYGVKECMPRPIPRMRPRELEADSDEDAIVVETLPATSSHYQARRSKLRLYGRSVPFALNKFTYNRTAPGTPAGNWRKKAYPV